MWLMTSLPNPKEGTQHLEILGKMKNVRPHVIVRAVTGRRLGSLSNL